ncbi:MAG: UDP-N-acetylglucosamine--LPS N-acetylglucosamine transferase [Clostridium sp.]|uniref:MGDG synthase family glycosyltransferase n=1 Tax=Clostridium sp. TaxID=1506 RepID=UPI00257AD9E2|nr:glycosyltransferase [Clostridium sp.]MBS4842724.1 UDP-N-acetylglucosamine--LPS N-acetylglucosamine transferase [Clostridium sp.]
MKKVLILTISTGQGHNQAAESVSDSFKDKGYEIVKHDFLKNNSKFLNDIIVKGYELMASKFPKTYGAFYKLTDTRIVNALLNFPFFFSRRKVSKLITEIKPDVIVATHALSTRIISELKKKGLNIPYILIVKKSLIERNIDAEKIYPLGIPINKKFYTEITNASELKDKTYFNLLLMSGSLGLNQISSVLKELLKNPNKLRITVVCGKNIKLKNTLTQYCNENLFQNKKLHILGFTKDVSYLMDYCDVIISKPGGLTVTESIVKNIPLIIPFAIPGQENENIDFLTSERYSILVNNLTDINDIINDLINNPKSLSDRKNRLKSLASTYSLDKIVYVAEDLINKSKK